MDNEQPYGDDVFVPPEIDSLDDDAVGHDVLLIEMKKRMLAIIRSGKEPPKEYRGLLKDVASIAIAEKRLKSDADNALGDNALAVAIANRLLDEKREREKNTAPSSVPVSDRLANVELPGDFEFSEGEMGTEQTDIRFDPESVKKKD